MSLITVVESLSAKCLRHPAGEPLAKLVGSFTQDERGVLLLKQQVSPSSICSHEAHSTIWSPFTPIGFATVKANNKAFSYESLRNDPDFKQFFYELGWQAVNYTEKYNVVFADKKYPSWYSACMYAKSTLPLEMSKVLKAYIICLSDAAKAASHYPKGLLKCWAISDPRDWDKTIEMPEVLDYV